MGRKRTLKQERKEKERKEKLGNIKDVPIPNPFTYSPESKNEGLTHIELKTLDFLNILTRLHLRTMLKEYECINYKHNRVLDIPFMFDSCRDLKKEDISRLDLIKKGFSTIHKEKRKNVNTGIDESDLQMSKKVHDSHMFNIALYTKVIRYLLAGFNKFRYDQCPNVNGNPSILETSGAPNRVLQETLLSLKITKEEMISEEIKEEEIRILAFGFVQDNNLVEFTINIPEIKGHDQNKISLYSSETGFGFYVVDLNGKYYTFELDNLANKVHKLTTKYGLKGKDSVVIRADKRKRGTWKQLFTYKNEIKDLWKEEMMEVLETINQNARAQMEPLEFIWNVALILVNCKADLLNLPPDLNHVNKRFETFDEMIIYYKTMIRFNSRLRSLFYILGGALYKNLLESSSLKKHSKNKDLTKCEKETMEEITNITDMNAKYYLEGRRLYFGEKNYEEANLYFEKALHSCPIPGAFVFKCISLIKIGRYKEAVMDAIFALRNLGSHDGYPAFFPVMKYQIESGSVIFSTDMANSLKYNFKDLSENQIQALKIMRRKGPCILKKLFKSHSLIFRKKFRDAIPFLEEIENMISIKSGHTSVILLLLYFVHKNYDKVFSLGEKIILENNNSYRNIVYYLLGMSSYYMKKLNDAIRYLEKLALIGFGELTRITSVRNVIQKADGLMKSGNLEESLFFYNYAKELVKDNDQLLAHIWKKLGVLNFRNKNFEKAIKCFTNFINLDGKTKNILVVRSKAYEQLGMMNEAIKDQDEAHNLS